MAWNLPAFVEQLFPHAPNTTVPVFDMSRGRFEGNGNAFTGFVFNPEMVVGTNNYTIYRRFYDIRNPLSHHVKMVAISTRINFESCEITYATTGNVARFNASWKDCVANYYYDTLNGELKSIVIGYNGREYRVGRKSDGGVYVTTRGESIRVLIAFEGRPAVSQILSLAGAVVTKAPIEANEETESVESLLVELKRLVERLLPMLAAQ